MTITSKRLKQLLVACKDKRIAVIGDIMLDKYIWGKVSRISPEAPVPVVDVHNESIRLGGAANVANNIKNLGGIPLLFGVIGDDHAGSDIKILLKKEQFDTVGIHIAKSRPTTLKTRIIADNQQVVRTDFESTEDVSGNESEGLIRSLKETIHDIDGIILQDYNKGVVTKNVIEMAVGLALERNCPVSADPKFNNFFDYSGVTIFKPNVSETQNALGFGLDSEERVEIAGKLLIGRLKCKNVLITRGSEGMSLFAENGTVKKVKTKARVIHDVSGAGDTVIGTLTLMLAGGGDVVEAAAISNFAAGVVCSEVGIVPVTQEKLIDAVENDGKSEE